MTKTKEKEKQKRVKERQGTQHRHGRKRGSKEIKRRTQKNRDKRNERDKKNMFQYFHEDFVQAGVSSPPCRDTSVVVLHVPG